MVMKKIRVGILFGGRSGEHEVSLLSAASVFNAIDKNKFEVVPIGITKDGRWVTATDAERLLKGMPPEHEERHLRAGDPDFTTGAAVLARGEGVVVPPEPRSSLSPFQTDLRRASDRAINVDIIFPGAAWDFWRGRNDSGLLELADIAYVGAGVLGSAAGMDKDVMKALFRNAGLPIVKHVTFLRREWEVAPKKSGEVGERRAEVSGVREAGESGILGRNFKARNRKELGPAIAEAAKFDRKIVIEQGVGGTKQKGARDRVLGSGERQSVSFGRGRDCSGQRVLRLRREVSRWKVRS